MIAMDDLSFSYTGSPPYLLESIRLHVHPGDYVSVLGENGSGKSTLLRLVLGLLRPTSGTLINRAGRIGYVPQKADFANSQFPITVYEMLSSYRRLLRLPDKNAALKSLALVRMESSRNALLGTLSGGQFQKIMLSRAMMGSPDLLVLDEPSTGVDRESQKEIYGIIKALNREKGITVLSVEHNLEAAIRNSTLIFHLSGSHGHLCTPQKYAEEYLYNGGTQDA